ncbi:catalase family protein [Atopomonas sediminilitoris]|uniref:catalase family protein n=1 Tax=Atopomonas sediminilitoris TaxID=2919919 RepID=UPI001F4DEF53|nr:catalase family protein [Atopomonas sediminilitoris]MCJ8167761.1 catalase family protein [Atopomonas sediminilitoris]
MLKRFFGKILALFAKLLLALGLIVLAGWGIAELYYSITWRGPVASVEEIPPGEAAMTQKIISDAIFIIESHKDNTRIMRDAHAKAHGCVRADVTVREDLPETLQQGAFKTPGQHYPAWVRFSNGNAYPQFDSARDARGMAIKLMNVEGKKLLPSEADAQTQDLVMFNQPLFFVSDVAEYQSNFAAQAEGQKIKAFFPSWDPRTWQFRHLIIGLKTLSPPPESPFTASYFSIAPFKYGPHNIKYRTVPDPERCPSYTAPEQNKNLPNFLRSSLYQQLSVDQVPACFAIQVQRQDPSKFMPLEDTSIEWLESDAPFETIAHLRIEAQDFDSPEQNLFCDNLSFTPWHSLPEHQPLGGINRLRRAAYEAVSAYRHERNGAPREEPTAETQPGDGDLPITTAP